MAELFASEDEDGDEVDVDDDDEDEDDDEEIYDDDDDDYVVEPIDIEDEENIVDIDEEDEMDDDDDEEDDEEDDEYPRDLHRDPGDPLCAEDVGDGRTECQRVVDEAHQAPARRAAQQLQDVGEPEQQIAQREYFHAHLLAV